MELKVFGLILAMLATTVTYIMLRYTMDKANNPHVTPFGRRRLYLASCWLFGMLFVQACLCCWGIKQIEMERKRPVINVRYAD